MSSTTTSRSQAFSLLRPHRLISMYLLLVTFLATFSSQVHAVPVNPDASLVALRRNARSFLLGARSGLSADGLGRRDVIAPKITSPDSKSVWPVGSTQIVTWDTSDFPPDSQITNPIGKVILGRDSGDSLNLDIQHPLAQGFKLRDGNVSIVVPDVPARNDYLIVLMGDSGNTSPTFAITRITGGGSTTPSQSSTSPGPSTSSTLITEPIPITGTTITGGSGTTEPLPTFSDTMSIQTGQPSTTPALAPGSSSQAETTTPATASTAGANSPSTTNAGSVTTRSTGLVFSSLILGLFLML